MGGGLDGWGGWYSGIRKRHRNFFLERCLITLNVASSQLLDMGLGLFKIESDVTMGVIWYDFQAMGVIQCGLPQNRVIQCGTM